MKTFKSNRIVSALTLVFSSVMFVSSAQAGGDNNYSPPDFDFGGGFNIDTTAGFNGQLMGGFIGDDGDIEGHQQGQTLQNSAIDVSGNGCDVNCESMSYQYNGEAKHTSKMTGSARGNQSGNVVEMFNQSESGTNLGFTLQGNTAGGTQ